MRKGIILVGVCGGLFLSAGTATIFAGAAESPYQGIVERNVFNLKPPPPPPSTEPPKAPPPKITLTGITTFLGTRALMQVPGTPKPGQPPTVESYILGEGQRDGDIEVLAIDAKAGTVKVNNHGTIQTLDFENNGSKLPAGPVAGTAPAGLLPGIRGPVPGNPTVLPRIPTRTMRLPPAASPNAPQGSLFPGVVAPRTQNELTPEQQAALIEVQRLKYQSQGNPAARILPPTELTPPPDQPR